MLDDIKFDLQTLDYRALTLSQWSELKNRLEWRARWDRNRPFVAVVFDARCELSGLATTVRILVGRWIARLRAALGREWRAYAIARRRRMAVIQLGAVDDRHLKDIGLRRCEIQSAVYRHNPSNFR
jgi:uncharacterized protein YjiS (DUF1127 family)